MLDLPHKTEKSHADGKILQSVDDGVGVVTFNNPDKRNAMSLDMWEGLGLALTDLRDDPAVRVVIMVGAGSKAFVSGADISQFEQVRHNAEAVRGIFQAQRRTARPARRLPQADHRLHQGILPRRRHAGRHAGSPRGTIRPAHLKPSRQGFDSRHGARSRGVGTTGALACRCDRHPLVACTLERPRDHAGDAGGARRGARVRLRQPFLDGDHGAVRRDRARDRAAAADRRARAARRARARSARRSRFSSCR